VVARWALLAALLASTGCDNGGVTTPTWHIANNELARAAAAGYPARVVLGDEVDAKPREKSETLLVVGPRSVKVIPAPRFEVFTNSGFEEYLRRGWVKRYLAVGDLDGALRAATRGYTRALEDQTVIPKKPPLPPVPDPNAWGFLYPSRNLDWGLAVSAIVAGLCVMLDRVSKRKTVDSSLTNAAR
jgi:hypothetical protein